MANEPYEFKLYRYTPSRIAAAIFVVLFALTTAGHMFQLIKRKTWYFIPFVLGGCFQVIGYVGRVLAHNNNKESVPIYSLQTILILLAPALYAASIYMVLARLIVTLDAQHLSLVPVKWMTKIFIVGDVIGFVGQAAGGGIMASGSISSLKLGEHITVAGLCVQILFSIFIVVATVFHRRYANAEGSRGLVAVGSTVFSHRTWETLLYALYGTSILI
ncbi:hypothetical protein DL98DRAFT_582662 [Cadophora sp. DSE1049]|nr:hypothetical protein DL98DRAFT_582662 [Cadophora sp. DSE1049]